MKIIKYSLIALLLLTFIGLESCGPVIISSRPNHPTPSWFYPNRVVNVRYIFFPEYMVYYDLTLRNYIYLDGGVWITVTILPQRFDSINFRSAKQIRINNYFGDNIRDHHNNRVIVNGRRTTSSNTKKRKN